MVRVETSNAIDKINRVTDLFNTNASIVRDLAKAVADHAPDANVLIISNPVR
jgi:malate dehydrogenase